MPKPPPPALSDAIKASMNEAHGYLMEAVFITQQLKVYFNREEYEEYERIYQQYEAFVDEREKDKASLMELDSKASTVEEKWEYAERLFAVVEKHTDRMRSLTQSFNRLIQAHRHGKP